MRFLLLAFILTVALTPSCKNSQTETKPPQETQESTRQSREEVTAVFQKFADSNYTGWKIKGWFLDEVVKSEEDPDIIVKSHYYLLLTKESKEKTIFVIKADFAMSDGTTSETIFEPSSQTLKDLQDKKAVEKDRKKLEDEREAMEDRSNDPR